MKRRFLYATAVFFFAILVTLVVWQGSFSFGDYGPASVAQTFVFWAVSTLVFILMITLAWMITRAVVKVLIERRKSREGSRLRTKLVFGALALSFLPVILLFVFSIQVLNRNLDKWFSRPIENIHRNLIDVSNDLDKETRLRARAVADWLADSPAVREYLSTGVRPALLNKQLCESFQLQRVSIRYPDGALTVVCSGPPRGAREPSDRNAYTANTGDAEITVQARLDTDLAGTQRAIEREIDDYAQLITFRKQAKYFYILLLLLMSLFVLYVATWIALFFARQLSVPISALVEAASQLRRGNLNHRIEVKAIDELGTLVRAFNEMASELQANERELERRRNFTEAILESIPTGVISLSGERRIQRVNSNLSSMLGNDRVSRAVRLEDLFPIEDARELHYLLNRASRTGIASAQMAFERDRQTLHLSITVAALVGKHTAGWVVVIEDTSELLRAQKAAAWHEVARRIAHEIKNPLTPISLSAERIARQLEKGEAAVLPADVARILKQCSLTISAEVESVKTLVNEFSQFARFPAAQPVLSSLNEVVEGALGVFAGRLEAIELVCNLAPDLPGVLIDRDQFKRVIVNLVDNAAEAMQTSDEPVLTVRTQLTSADSVELIIADNGHGISPEDRDRLFLPYFSTKGRGTGLGLAIVHHILSDHGAQIRVEENEPRGARFIIEMPVPAAETLPAETPEVNA